LLLDPRCLRPLIAVVVVVDRRHEPAGLHGGHELVCLEDIVVHGEPEVEWHPTAPDLVHGVRREVRRGHRHDPLLLWLLLEDVINVVRADGVIVVENAEVRTLELVGLDELGEALAAGVAVEADGAVGAARVGDAVVGLEELEGEAGTHCVKVR
jgi:hypothetical protein